MQTTHILYRNITQLTTINMAPAQRVSSCNVVLNVRTHTNHLYYIYKLAHRRSAWQNCSDPALFCSFPPSALIVVIWLSLRPLMLLLLLLLPHLWLLLVRLQQLWLPRSATADGALLLAQKWLLLRRLRTAPARKEGTWRRRTPPERKPGRKSHVVRWPWRAQCSW